MTSHHPTTIFLKSVNPELHAVISTFCKAEVAEPFKSYVLPLQEKNNQLTLLEWVAQASGSVYEVRIHMPKKGMLFFPDELQALKDLPVLLSRVNKDEAIRRETLSAFSDAKRTLMPFAEFYQFALTENEQKQVNRNELRQQMDDPKFNWRKYALDERDRLSKYIVTDEESFTHNEYLIACGSFINGKGKETYTFLAKRKVDADIQHLDKQHLYYRRLHEAVGLLQEALDPVVKAAPTPEPNWDRGRPIV